MVLAERIPLDFLFILHSSCIVFSSTVGGFCLSLGKSNTPPRQDSDTAASRRGSLEVWFRFLGGRGRGGCCLSAPQLSECVPIGGMSLAV